MPKIVGKHFFIAHQWNQFSPMLKERHHQKICSKNAGTLPRSATAKSLECLPYQISMNEEIARKSSQPVSNKLLTSPFYNALRKKTTPHFDQQIHDAAIFSNRDLRRERENEN